MVWPFSSNSEPPTPEAPKEPAYSIRMPQKLEQSADALAARRRRISDAVQENCALDQAAFFECQQQWNIWSKLTLCQHFQRRYYDCQKAQRIFLAQMGYGAQGNTEAEDQLIKWHADELFQKQCRDRDKADTASKATEIEASRSIKREG